MQLQNNKRHMVNIIYDIAREENIEIKSFSYDWIFMMKKGDVYRYIYGYNFDINSSGVYLLTNDKSATSDILGTSDIPHVEHKFFISPCNLDYIGENGNWNNMICYAQDNDWNIVCKSNNGTGGNEVYRVRNQIQLEGVVFKLFKDNRSIALSPYQDIKNEYRVIYLDGEVMLTYGKNRNSVTADGVSTLKHLINNKYCGGDFVDFFRLLDEETLSNLDHIFPNGEIVNLNWKHNLAKGASAFIVQDQALKDKLALLCADTANLLNIKMASIDIIDTDNGFLIMEINSGIMMENFIRNAPQGYDIAKTIYKKAILKMFKFN